MAKNTTASDKRNDTKKDAGFLDLDISHLLPKEYAAEDLVQVGGFRPIIASDVTFEEKSPIVGHVVTLLDMPKRLKIGSKTGEKEAWQALLVRLVAPTIAKLGDDQIKVEAGKDVLVPINGNLRNNIDLLGAAVDPNNVWLVGMYVEGQVAMKDDRNDMWSWDVKIHKKPIARTGAFALFNKQDRYRPQLDGKTSDGQVFDSKTGEIRSAVGPAAG